MTVHFDPFWLMGYDRRFLFCRVLLLEMSDFPIFRLVWENEAFQDQIFLADDIQNKPRIKLSAYRIIIFADNNLFPP